MGQRGGGQQKILLEFFERWRAACHWTVNV